MSDFASLFGGAIDDGTDIGTTDFSTDFPTTNTDVSDLFGTSGNLDSTVDFYDPLLAGSGGDFSSPVSSPTPTSFLGGLNSDLNSFFGDTTQSGTTPANQTGTSLGGLLSGLGTLFQPTLNTSGGVPTTANASTTGLAGGLFSNPLILIGGIVVLVLLLK